MSKTIRGQKGSGYEYWSKRPGKDGPPGKDTKRRTHRAERREGNDRKRMQEDVQ